MAAPSPFAASTEDTYRIVVGDDGVGLPEGTTWPVPGKLGALILKSLSENAKTHHAVETAPGEGTCVTIEFIHRATPGSEKLKLACPAHETGHIDSQKRQNVTAILGRLVRLLPNVPLAIDRPRSFMAAVQSLIASKVPPSTPRNRWAYEERQSFDICRPCRLCRSPS
jgi:hypothetical protein